MERDEKERLPSAAFSSFFSQSSRVYRQAVSCVCEPLCVHLCVRACVSSGCPAGHIRDRVAWKWVSQCHQGVLPAPFSLLRLKPAHGQHKHTNLSCVHVFPVYVCAWIAGICVHVQIQSIIYCLSFTEMTLSLSCSLYFNFSLGALLETEILQS